MIIVDDGSTDQTPKLLNDAMARLPWLRRKGTTRIRREVTPIRIAARSAWERHPGVAEAPR